MLIRLTSLVSTDKIQKKCSFRTRLVGLISTKTKEYFVGGYLCIRSISGTSRGDGVALSDKQREKTARMMEKK